MIAELFLLSFLLYFSYTDWKTREIDDRLVYLAFGLGVLLNLHQPAVLGYSLMATAAVAGILYILGAFAQGDFWVALIISAFLPEPLFGVPLGIWALLGGVLLGGIYGFLKMLARNPREWVKMWVGALLYAIPFSVNPLLGVILVYNLRYCPWIFLFLLPLSRNPLPVAVSLLVAATALKAMREAGKVFTVVKKIEEGDIPAEVVDEEGRRYPLDWKTALMIKKGEVKPVHSAGADGLTKEDVERLKEMGIEEMRVKEPLPLVPFIAGALALILIYLHFLR